MVNPEPAEAPVMPPVIVPMVQVKLLATEAVKLMPVPVPLQMVAVTGVNKEGAGLTVTVIVKGVPVHEPITAVGVTI